MRSKVSSNSNGPARVRRAWSILSEEEKRLLLPHLLNGMLGWQVRASDPLFAMMWIKEAFKNARVPLPGR